LQINQLTLSNFKNYEKETFRFSPRFNCMVGRNGMGKTNLLDALYYLCMGKSYFVPNDRHIVLHNAAFFRLEGHFQVDEKKEKIVAKVIPQKKKELERNGVAYAKLSEHVGLLPVVIIIPDDTLLATEGSEERRRFLDNTISQLDPIYLRHLIQYQKILRQRNAALKQMGENGRFQESLIEIYDAQLREPGQYIHQKRRAFVDGFNPLLAQMYQLISNGAETAQCRYRSALDKEPDLLKLLRANREKDRILQRTTNGLHRDDLIFHLDNHPLKRFASQGQLKSYILALKLAQYELIKKNKQQRPLLLLDDIFDKLDQYRVDQLLSLLMDGDYGQIFITDTDEKRVSQMLATRAGNYREFLITNGKAVAL
jgi:DNA replication and repair protein RecF